LAHVNWHGRISRETIGGFKKARGQASEDYMKDNGGKLGEFCSAEGISTMVPYKGSAERIIDDLIGGLRSAMSYCGAQNIKDFQKKAQFAVISGTIWRTGRISE
jgi:IMP dehydrogenase